MSLSDLASLGSFVSGVAVLASLVYLAVQTNQNIQHTRALIHQGSAARTTAIRLGLMDRERVAAFLEGNGQEATAEAVRQFQFILQCRTALDALEDHYLQHQAHLVNPEQHARAREDFRSLFSLPGVRGYWNQVREAESRAAPGFGAFVDSLCNADPSS